MTISLYAATIPVFDQLLGSLGHLLNRAQAFCDEGAVDESEIVQAQFADDMLPFCYQVKSAVVHSAGAIASLPSGVFHPDFTEPPQTFEALRTRVSEGRDFLGRIDRASIDQLTGRDMRFEFKDVIINFTAENFLFSFSIPNFHFHVTTAYDLLRWKGLQISKRDYLGQMLTKK